MPSDHLHDFLSVVAMLVLAIVLAVWLIGLSVEREKAHTQAWKPPQKPPPMPKRVLAKDVPWAVQVPDMPGYYWIGWGRAVHGMETVEIGFSRI